MDATLKSAGGDSPFLGKSFIYFDAESPIPEKAINQVKVAVRNADLLKVEEQAVVPDTVEGLFHLQKHGNCAVS